MRRLIDLFFNKNRLLHFINTWLLPFFLVDWKTFKNHEIQLVEKFVERLGVDSSLEKEGVRAEIESRLRATLNKLEEREVVVGDTSAILTYEEYVDTVDKTFYDPVHDKTAVTNDNLLKQDPLLIAQQLTLIDVILFRQIPLQQLLELLGNVKSAPLVAGSKEPDSVIKRITKRWDTVVLWIVTIILQSNSPLDALKFFVCVAKHLREMRNFHTLMQVQTALEHNSVFRLQLTKVKSFFLRSLTFLIFRLKNLETGEGDGRRVQECERTFLSDSKFR